MGKARIRKVAKKAISFALRVSGIGASGPHMLPQDQHTLRNDFAGEAVTARLWEWEDKLQSPAVPLDGKPDQFAQFRSIPQKAIFFDIREPGYSFQQDMAFDAKRRFFTSFEDVQQLPIMRKPLEKPQRNDGCIGFHANDATNYYNWMCFGLPVSVLYREAGVFDDIDAFYVGNNSSRTFQSQTLEKMLPGAKCISTPLLADRLVYAQLLSVTIMPKSFHKLVRNLYVGADTKTPTRRLYIARGATKRRRLIGEEPLVESLQSKGFEICRMDKLTVQEQADLFASAEIIIAPHGAALTNLIFASPGCKVVEIFSAGYTLPYFYGLADHSGASYAYYRAKGDPPPPGVHGHDLDIHLDAEDFLKRAYGHLQI